MPRVVPDKRMRRPRKASPDEVRITREGDTAIIDYADPSIMGVNLQFGPVLAEMTDAEVLAEHNAILESQAELIARDLERPLIEIPPGLPQINYHELSQQWSPRGDVLRCHIGFDQGETVIWIDDLKFDLDAFGKLFEVREGWAMRIAFVDEDLVAYEREIEVKDPEESQNG